MTTKLIFLGGGNMAEAIFAGLVNNPQFKIAVIQRNLEKAARLKSIYPNIKVTATLDYTLKHDDILVLAIKPQQAKESCSAIKDKISNCLIVSVMAGLSINSINSWLNNPRIIRSMPNTPSSVGKGITALYAPDTISADEEQIVGQIFTTVGMTYHAQNEAEIDKIVPVSSSSIAFIYYFMEGLIESAVSEFGFERQQATALVKQVISGSSALLDANPEVAISEHRARVTSQKGATEQGVLTFEREQLHLMMKHAMQNCYARTLEMAKEFN